MLNRALELDPDLATAHARMSTVQRRAWNFAGAQNSTDRALALEPRNPIVIGNAAFLYYALGQMDQAIALFRRTIHVDPMILHGYWFLAESFITAGYVDSAMTPLLQLRERSPDYWPAFIAIGNIHLLQSDAEQARSDFAQLQELHPGDPEDAAFYRAIVEHTAQNSAASAAAADEFEQRTNGIDPFRCAQIRAWRGEIDAAFRWLDKAYEVHDPLLHSIKTDVYLRPLHTDPRWTALLEAIGVPVN
jgi:tetratricopeptide (TPR) repeat protein